MHPTVGLGEQGTLSIHQLVIRERGADTPEEWIVTDIQESESELTIILADPAFDFRLSITESVFNTKGFVPLTTVDGSPVWGY